MFYIQLATILHLLLKVENYTFQVTYYHITFLDIPTTTTTTATTTTTGTTTTTIPTTTTAPQPVPGENLPKMPCISTTSKRKKRASASGNTDEGKGNKFFKIEMIV